MNAIRIRKHLDSATLVLPELQPLVGKDVEIIVLEDSASRAWPDGWFEATAGSIQDPTFVREQ
jgi:hypothetical protein